MDSEFKRKAVHIGMVAWALLIGRVSPWLICLCCALALLFNIWLLPRITAGALDRESDRDRGFALGIILYPAVLLMLSIAFLDQQVFLAIGWGAMAFGDGLAGLFGRRLGGSRIPWNPSKTWAGLFAFVLFGTPLTWIMVMLLPASVRAPVSPQLWLLAIAGAMTVAAWLESLPGLIDDNLAVPIAAAAMAWSLLRVDAVPELPAEWQFGVGLVALLVIVSIGSRKIDVAGGLVGGLIAWAIFSGAGLAGLSALFAFFALGSFASSWRRRDKQALGLEQENQGRRTVRHAMANGSFAGICGLVAWFGIYRIEVCAMMIAASLASATADTLSSELGNVYGKRFINILTLKNDLRGRDGVISLEGTLLGALGAAVVAAIWVAWSHSPTQGVWVLLAGLVGNAMDSVLGASLQRWGLMTNDTVNFANTCVAGIMIFALAMAGLI